MIVTKPGEDPWRWHKHSTERSATARAHVVAILDKQLHIFRWTTSWQAEGHCSLSDEGTTWVRGWVDANEADALLASFALEAGRSMNGGPFPGFK